MNPLLALARPDLLELEPYQHAAWEPALERLHANENPWRAPGDNSPAGLNRYPEPQPQSLIKALAALYEVTPDRVLVGRGSDEAIDLIVRAFCRAGIDGVLIVPPTFGMYKVAARIQGARVHELVVTAAQAFAPTAQALLDAWRPDVKLVFLCTPNNPTGNSYDESVIIEVARALLGKALIVVDEAYLEFAGRPSVARLQSDLPNIVVLRTLSKAFALAGARCGTLIADPAVVSLLQRIIPPYAIPAATIDIVERVLQPPQLVQCRARVGALIAARAALADALAELRCVRRVFPSQANFLLVEFNDAARAFELSRNAGLLIRDVRRQPGLERCLRITLGNPDQNRRLVAALEQA
jgi:histidinol-phosphate aminotransferase